MRFLLADSSLFEVPRTLKLDRIMAEQDYEVVRSPFSTIMAVAGDGLPKAEPFNISGTAYFATGVEATNWVFALRDALPNIEYLVTDDFYMEVSYVDFTVVPTLLPRILKVTMKVYPSNTMPNFYDWPDGLTLEYRFDDGEGSTLTEYVSGANATITNPVWGGGGLEMASGRYVTLPAAANTLLGSSDWTQVMAMVGEGTTPLGGGVVGSTTAVNLSGEMFRSTGLKTGLVTGTSVTEALGGDLWNGTPRILFSMRLNSHIRGLEIKPTIGFEYLAFDGDVSTGAAGTLTFGRNDTLYMDGKLLYYVAFNRRLANAETEKVYDIIRMKVASRGVGLTW